MHTEDSTDEEWRPVHGYLGFYEVSNHGRVRSLTRKVTSISGRTRTVVGRVLKPASKPTGHMHVGMSVKNKLDVQQVHALVLRAFVGPAPAGCVCRHLDGDPGNNHLSNLVWGTLSENSMDMIRHGRSATKLTAEQVRAIRLSGDTDKVEAAKHGVSRTCISAVRNGRTYRWVK